MLGAMLQWFPGYGFSDMLNQLEAFGFFQYVLPFLLIFAVVYAILAKIPVFTDNKGAAVIAAVAIGFLSLQLDFVPAFFQSIFPNLGIGLSILLAGLILAGAFISSEYEKAYSWIFFGLGILIFLFVMGASLASYQFTGSWRWTGWWEAYGGLIVFALILGGVITAVVLSGRHGSPGGNK